MSTAPLPLRRLLLLLGILALLLVTLEPVDAWVWRHWRMPEVYASDLGRLLRVVGFAPTWLLAAVVLLLARWSMRRAAGWRTAFLPAIALAAAVLAAGALGEVLKLVVRRSRPAVADGWYHFAGWDPFTLHTGSFGFPSTHAVVAFAAAFALSRLVPRTWPVWFALAAGCGLTRVLAGAHFASDVLAAAVVAYGVVLVLFARLRPAQLAT